MSHFYLTLPSNSSTKYFPNNTLTHFITKLHNDVSLQGDWEVGLVDIMYPRNWYNVSDQYLLVTCGDCAIKSPELAPEEQEVYLEKDIKIPIPSKYYSSCSELVTVLNDSITERFRSSISGCDYIFRYADPLKMPKFDYGVYNKKVFLTMHESMIVRLSKKLAKILNMFERTHIDATENPSGILSVESDKPCKIEDEMQALYVYCDILECVPVGDTMAPLLRIAQVSGSRGEEMTHIQFDQPRYIPIQKKSFDSIEIDIRDDAGDPVPFDSGKLIVTLHFRQAKDTYFLG